MIWGQGGLPYHLFGAGGSHIALTPAIELLSTPYRRTVDLATESESNDQRPGGFFSPLYLQLHVHLPTLD